MPATSRWSPMAAPGRCTPSQVAREIGISTVIIPAAPGVFSAFGMLFSDLRYDFVRTWFTRLEDAPFDEIERVYRELERPGPRRHRRHLGQAAEDRGQARRRHALCRPGARRHRRPAARGVRAAGPRRDQAPFRRDARAALRHLARRTSAPRSSACARPSPASCASRRRRSSIAAARQTAARARQAAFTGKRPVLFRRQVPRRRRPLRARRSLPATASRGRR